MSPEEEMLWNKIKQFQFDEPGVAFLFSDRLARENGWERTYALRVIEEYRKFIFLCCVSKTGVTPSNPVDQAWHLHLTYTKSYWIDLCRNTLQQEVHHNPTRGGTTEARKFDGYYAASHWLYKEMFGTDPPRDIWQDNYTRFTDVRFQRVNLRKYWLVPKPFVRSKKGLQLSALLLLGCCSLQASFETASYVFIGCLILLSVWIYKNRRKGGDDSGGATTSCNFDTTHNNSHHEADASTSGCSGCSASGCSGCSGD